MAKYHSSDHVHPFPWSSVAAAIFMRYPNPFATHVLSEDTLERRVIKDGVLYRYESIGIMHWFCLIFVEHD